MNATNVTENTPTLRYHMVENKKKLILWLISGLVLSFLICGSVLMPRRDQFILFGVCVFFEIAAMIFLKGFISRHPWLLLFIPFLPILISFFV